MEEIKLSDIYGLWLGKEFNLFIGSQRNPNFGNLVDILGKGKKSIETKNLQLSETTPDNTRMLIFDNENSIEIWSLNLAKSKMTITVDDNRYDLVLRPS
ncbi:hypothetical protein V2611_01490 [Tenacibaculum maritimum]|uniref:hypothetical protein n=1 Tax=Tenacibaculum maritimum TaxID=107401 RepID=UPI0038765FBE